MTEATGRRAQTIGVVPIVLVAALVLVTAAPRATAFGAAPAPAELGSPEPAATPASAVDEGCDCQRLIVPIYPSNTGEWDQAVAAGMPAGSVLILNLGGTRAGDDPERSKGGPGSGPDPAMQQRVREAQARGYYVIGYIRTGATGSNPGPRRDRAYTDREIADLEGWYDVDGIFYDEVYATAGYLDYYVDLVAHGRQVSPGLHVLNFGGSPDERYAALGDVIGTFEGSVEDFKDWSLSSWQRDYPPSRWAVAVMSVRDAEEMRRVVRRARQQNIGYVYATDLFGTSTENPWYRLPPYWDEQVAKHRSCWEERSGLHLSPFGLAR